MVLTGVDLTSYGHDLPGSPTLGMLVERILMHVPKLARLRLSSLDSIEIDDRLAEMLTGEARVMPHVHLSFQAGSDLILKRMKRRHSRVQAVAAVAAIFPSRISSLVRCVPCWTSPCLRRRSRRRRSCARQPAARATPTGGALCAATTTSAGAPAVRPSRRAPDRARR